jgi:uncharacterized protein YndB with AHSA1/START domain
MIEVDETLEVDAPPDAVFAVVTRVARYPAWIPGATAAEALPGAAEGTPGSRFRLRFAGPMGPIEADGEVTEADPPRSFRLRAVADLFNLEAGCAVADAAAADGSGSRVRATARLELRGMARFLEGPVRSRITEGMPEALATLRDAIEAEAAAAPADPADG